MSERNAPAPAARLPYSPPLRLLRLLWLVMAGGALMLWLLSVPGFYARISTLTVTPVRLGERVILDNADVQRESTERGLSLAANAAYDIALDALQIGVYYFVAGLVLWRAGTAFGWFTAFVLMLLTTNNMQTTVAVARLFPGADSLIQAPSYLVWPFFLLWIHLFPNGRAVPRQLRIPLFVLLTGFVLLQILSILAINGLLPAAIDSTAAAYAPLLAPPLFGLILVSQVYRYRRVSTAVERQQTKWFLFGVVAVFLDIVLFVAFRDRLSHGYWRDLQAILFLPFPLAVAVAVLRYRLFDIDVLIRRTLIYGVLTALLVLVYFGAVVVLQQVFRGLTGQGDDLAIILSTLGSALLFVPLRNRVQTAIDHRFYRRKYDAARVLEAFGATVRDEVDLKRLTDTLVAVVDETVQPEYASVWLRTTEDGRRGTKV